VKLNADPSGAYVLLSYPGMETNGTVVIAPLIAPDNIAIVETLHPIVETPTETRVIAVERLAAISPDFMVATTDTLIEYEYEIQRALSRLFYGN